MKCTTPKKRTSEKQSSNSTHHHDQVCLKNEKDMNKLCSHLYWRLVRFRFWTAHFVGSQWLLPGFGLLSTFFHPNIAMQVPDRSTEYGCHTESANVALRALLTLAADLCHEWGQVSNQTQNQAESSDSSSDIGYHVRWLDDDLWCSSRETQPPNATCWHSGEKNRNWEPYMVASRQHWDGWPKAQCCWCIPRSNIDTNLRGGSRTASKHWLGGFQK